MDKKLFKYDLLGFIFINIIGTLSHFIYNWSNENKIVALFCPVNESVWEHLKLLFFPFFLYIIFEFIKLKGYVDQNSFWAARFFGIEIGMFTTLSIHYVYNGATGKESMAIDILSFIIGIFIAFFTSYIMARNNALNKVNKGFTLAVFTLQSVILFIFTFIPPYLPIFMDSQTMTYGI